jgi:hypothetical protein
MGMPPVFWIQRQDIGPSARSGHAMADDTGRNRVVLFGGDAVGLPLGDTWEWDGNLWTQVADIGPSARRRAALAYSPVAARLFLFGGRDASGLVDDTWAFDGADWIQVEDTGPPARSGHAIAYDPVRERLVMFGGHGSATVLDDTWEWDGSVWVQVQDTGPAPRYGHVLGYDAALERVVLFGGGDANGTGLGDTWTWDGSNWTQAADTGPASRSGAAVSGGGSILVFGGVSAVDPTLPPGDRMLYGDTWRWSAGQWVQLQDIGPGPRWGHGMAFRPGAGRTVLFGGSRSVASAAADLLSDTWEVPDQAGAPGPGAAGGVHVVFVQVHPQIMFPPALQPLTVNVQLSGPAVAGSSLTISIYTVQNNNPVAVVNPSGYTIPSITFAGGEGAAQFTLAPNGLAMPHGDDAVMVAVGGGAPMGAAFRFAL